MIYSCVTDKGKKRPSNQDACFAYKPDENSCIAVVCDGMGGERAGDVASGIAVNAISERVCAGWRHGMKEASVVNLLTTAVNAANILVFDEAQANEEYDGMGTTVVAAVVNDGQMTVVHAGDSRCYLFDGTLRRVTKDHSFVQGLVDSGKITENEAKTHPERNYITRALGVAEHIDLDFNSLPVSSESRILICSDGLYNFVDDNDIEKIISTGGVEDAAQRLVDAANANGGGDNITAVVISSAQGE